MARPVDWLPLADADPVPGDPQRISEQAAHLAGTAQELSGQVARLRAIAAGQSAEQGLHADKLRSASADVAGGLAKVVGRYQKTSAALSAWVPELEYAQSQSLKALAQAQDAAARQRASQPVARPAGYPETSQDKLDDQNRVIALSQADSDLAAARQMLNNATSYRDQKGSETRHKIENAINDGITDTWWDKFKGFIGRYAWLIQDFCTGMEIIATLFALACLFIPGLNIVDALLLAGFILTAAATAGRAVLAVTGNGSWLDFVLDAAALVSFGLSKYFSSELEMAAKGAQQTSHAGLVEEYLAKYAGGTAEDAAQYAAKDIARVLPDAARPFGSINEYFNAVWRTVKAGGSLDDAQNYAKIQALFAEYGRFPDIAATLSKGKLALTVLWRTFLLNTGISVSSMIGSGGGITGPDGTGLRIPDFLGIEGQWDDLERAWTTPGGLTTAQANFLVNVAQFTPLGPAASAFRVFWGGGW